VVASLAVLVMAIDGSVSRWEGVVLFAGLLGYMAWAVVVERGERAEPDDVVAEYEAEVGAGADRRHWLVDAALAGGGLVLLVLGARWLVGGASDIAVALGMSELLVGVTIVAIGTSLPELATSVVAAVRGERDIAVGNVVGSNLFNLLGVLGLTALVSPVGVPVGDQALNFQLPALVVVSLLCFGIFYTSLAVHRWEGVALLVLYVAYMAYTVAEAADSSALGVIQVASVVLVVAVGVAVAVTTRRALRDGNPADLVPPSG
jgi:cation:H+ antiporter